MLSLGALLLLVLPALGSVHESLDRVPNGWREASEQPSDDGRLQLHIALQYQNIDSLDSRLSKLSTPGSKSYGKWLSQKDVDGLFAPSTRSRDKVKSWLQKSGVSDIEFDGSTVSFATTIGHANKLLDTRFGLYTNGKHTKLRTLQYSVPDDLKDDVDLISPTTFFGNMRAHRAIPETQPSKTERAPMKVRQLKQSCETTITVSGKNYDVIGPECLKQLYNVGDYKADPNSGSNIAFGSFLAQSASYSDLEEFESIFDLPSHNFSVTTINGGVDNQDPATAENGEANLDVQNIIGLVDGLPVSEYITAGKPPFIPDLLLPNASANTNEPYLPYYKYLLDQSDKDLPYVISNSYGDHENTVPENMQSAFAI